VLDGEMLEVKRVDGDRVMYCVLCIVHIGRRGRGLGGGRDRRYKQVERGAGVREEESGK
jgi:hypothetical protein